MSKYKDIDTKQEYDDIPNGKVQPIIVNGYPVTEEAYNNYYYNHPTELDELTVSPPASKSTTMSAYYDRVANASPNNFIRHVNTLHNDERIRRANYWKGIQNVMSPSLWVGASIDAAQGEKDFLSGLWYGNNGYVPDKFAQLYPITSMALNAIGDATLMYGGAKLYNWGTIPRVKYGTETPIVEYTYFSPKVTKHTTITPVEMHIRNNTPGFVKSTYQGIDSNGLYVYTLPKMWFPKNPKIAFNRVLNNAIKKGYEKITHPNLLGPALISKRLNRVISDFGNNGLGLVGWTWKGPGFGDAAFETVPEFLIAMEKKGGKLTNEKH